ncbi:small G protein signaling modulator 3-like isoform X2 [Sycon ciliatum]
MEDEDVPPSSSISGLAVPGSVVDSAIASQHTTPISSRAASSSATPHSTNGPGNVRSSAGSPAVLNVASSHSSEPFSAIRSDVIPPELASQSTTSPLCQIYDEFGFEVNDEDARLALLCPQMIEDPMLRLRWQAYLEFRHNQEVKDFSWEQLADHLPQDDKLEELVKCGVPHRMRAELWPRLCGARAKQRSSTVSYKDLLARALDSSIHGVARQIDKDLLRTMPQSGCFARLNCPGVKSLRNILRCIAEAFPEIGYCQGTGMIIASLLLILDEETTFWMMVKLIEDILPPEYYGVTLIGAQTDQRVLRQLVKTHLPPVDKVLEENNLELSMITMHWYITVFASVLPFPVLLRIWDLFFYHGSVTLFRIALAMFNLKAEDISNADGLAQLCSCLQELPSEMIDAQVLVAMGFDITDSLTPAALSAHRQVHYAALAEILNNSQPTPKPVFELSSGLSSRLASRRSNKPANIVQQEIVTTLRDNIRNIVQHFKTNCGIPEMPVDYSNESHLQDYITYAQSFRNHRRRRARALVDFERQEHDELGFNRHDIITIISQRDEHCWIGEVNSMRGWFPAKFVELLDERSKLYSAAGDDSVNEAVAHLVRGGFCSALRGIFDHGLRKPKLFGRVMHPWYFIEEASRAEVSQDFQSVFSRLVLSKTFCLEKDGKVLTPEEMLYRSMEAVNLSHSTVGAPMDVKFRSLISAGLNEQALHLWFETLCLSRSVVERWYEPWSYIRSPGWVQIKCELRLLAAYSFKLSLDWEISSSPQVSQPLKDSVRDMLIKHHLFSWDL